MSDNSGNGKLTGRILFVEELDGTLVTDHLGAPSSAETAKSVGKVEEIPSWEYAQTLSHKSQSKILVVEVKGYLSDFMGARKQ